MKQDIRNISSFNRGDEITRVIPSRPYPNMMGDLVPDYNYIGIKLVFIGLLNGCIYLEKEQDNIFSMIFKPLFDKMEEESNNDNESLKSKRDNILETKKSLIKLPIDIWEEGWSIYLDPKDYFKLDDKIEMNVHDETLLNKELKKAISDDNFEKAEELKKQLENLKNKK